MKKSICFISTMLVLSGTMLMGQTEIVSDIVITRADIDKAGTSIPASSIGEPVSSVMLYEPRWVEVTDATPAYAVVEGSMFPVDPNGWPINFKILLPATWSRRAMQSGGGGNNGTISVRERNNPMLSKGFAIYGSDGGHQTSFGGGRDFETQITELNIQLYLML